MSRWWHWHWNFPVFSLAAALGAAAAAAIVLFAQIGQSAAPAAAGAGTNIPLHASLTSALVKPSGHATAQHRAGGWEIHLTVKNLPGLGAGQFYECWYAGAGNRPGHPKLITAGTFTARTGSFTMWSAADPGKFRRMLITAQSAGNPGKPGLTVLEGSPQ
jgi:hypothetical protein